MRNGTNNLQEFSCMEKVGLRFPPLGAWEGSCWLKMAVSCFSGALRQMQVDSYLLQPTQKPTFQNQVAERVLCSKPRKAENMLEEIGESSSRRPTGQFT